MKNQSEIQKRFLEENTQMRLGHLASDLARVASLIEMYVQSDTVKSVLEEAKFFSEWAAQGTELDTQAYLPEIQSVVAQTELAWDSHSNDGSWREKVAQWARIGANRLLKKAGLINSDEQS